MGVKEMNKHQETLQALVDIAPDEYTTYSILMLKYLDPKFLVETSTFSNLYEDALDYLEHCSACSDYFVPDIYNEAIKILKELVSKERCSPATNGSFVDNDGNYICGNCGEKYDKSMNYCSRCGQKLWWHKDKDNQLLVRKVLESEKAKLPRECEYCKIKGTCQKDECPAFKVHNEKIKIQEKYVIEDDEIVNEESWEKHRKAKHQYMKRVPRNSNERFEQLQKEYERWSRIEYEQNENWRLKG